MALLNIHAGAFRGFVNLEAGFSGLACPAEVPQDPVSGSGTPREPGLLAGHSYRNDRAKRKATGKGTIRGGCIRVRPPETGAANISNGGNGLQGYVDASGSSDTREGAFIDEQGHAVLIEGVAAADLTVDDFTFLRDVAGRRVTPNLPGRWAASKALGHAHSRINST